MLKPVSDLDLQFKVPSAPEIVLAPTYEINSNFGKIKCGKLDDASCFFLLGTEKGSVMTDASKKLKILCLHGYRQNSLSFQHKMNGFRKSIKSVADLVFITAPHLIPGESNSDCIEDDYSNIGQTFSWWFCDESNSFGSLDECEEAKGFKESIDLISETFQSSGPFDGILGFSQGAALAALICGLKECHEFMYNFQFVILISGFMSIAKCHQYLYEKKLTTKSLHVIGLNDTCIVQNRSKDLSTLFQSCDVVHHEGGHYVPCHSNVKKEYISFLKTFVI